MVQLGSEGHLEAEFFPSFLLRPSTDWMRPTHIVEGNLFTQSLLIQK